MLRCFLAEDAKLPQATSSACSDIGYHGQFFLDVAPPSLRRSHVKGRLNVTAASIDDFVKVPYALGAWPHQSQSYPGGYRAIRQEMGERLQSVTRGVPAALPFDSARCSHTALSQALPRLIEERLVYMLSQQLAALPACFSAARCCETPAQHVAQY